MKPGDFPRSFCYNWDTLARKVPLKMICRVCIEKYFFLPNKPLIWNNAVLSVMNKLVGLIIMKN